MTTGLLHPTPPPTEAPALRALGHLQLVTDHRVDLGGSKQRALVARLLVDAGRPVSVDRLIDAIWGETPPDRPHTSLQSYVSRLRRVFAGVATITGHEHAYSIDIPTEHFDVLAAERLLARARRASADGDRHAAIGQLTQAIELWGGRPFDEFADEEWARPHSTRLTELLLAAWEDLIDARMALGEHRHVISDVQALVAAHPTREGLVERWVIALARSGRQADGLAALRRHRRQLIDEFGLDPDPRLQRLEHELLLQSDGLLDATQSTPRPAEPTPAPQTSAAPETVDRASDRPSLRRPSGRCARRTSRSPWRAVA